MTSFDSQDKPKRRGRSPRPIKRTMPTNPAELCVEAVNDAAESLHEYISGGDVTMMEVDQISVAYEEFKATLAKAKHWVDERE